MDQVFRDFGLAVDGHDLTVGEPGELDTLSAAVQRNVERLMDEPFPGYSLADASNVQQVDRGLLEDARTNPPLDVSGHVARE